MQQVLFDGLDTFSVVYVRVIFAPYHNKQVLFLWLQSSKKSSADAEIEGPPLLKYSGKDGRFKDEKDLKVRITHPVVFILNFTSSRVTTLCITLLKLLVTAIVSLLFFLRY